jgi:formylglycine-generating enzyme required for sulfatase activity
LSQWYAACTSNGTYSSTGYPYGNTYQATYCNGFDYWNGDSTTAQALPVGSLSTCQSSVLGYQGIYDMSGNAWEWEDSCNGTTGQSDSCGVRGGGFYFAPDFWSSSSCNGNLECGCHGSVIRGGGYGFVFGFRCCAP